MLGAVPSKSQPLEVRISNEARAILRRIASHYGVDGLSPATVVQLLIQEKADELGIEGGAGAAALCRVAEA